MSVRYTGETTMDEPALRDVERWKDKIEVRLDNRQVFFLFFGSAMVACMLFVLGVIVGKRLETRGRAEAPAMEDPLAVLDRFGIAASAPAAPAAALAFPRALTGGAASADSGLDGGFEKRRSTAASSKDRAEKLPSRADRLAARSTMAATMPATMAATMPSVNGLAPGPVPKLTPALAPLPRPLAPVVPPARVAAASPSPSPSTISTPPVPSARRLAALPRPFALSSDAPSGAAAAVSPPPSAPSKAATAPPARTAAPGGADKAKGRFLLQLSSFQDRAEADAFARRFGSQSAYVVATEIPGKGTWYRVRVGSYATMQDATQAKASFEREHNVIAYVAGGGTPAR